MKKVILISLLIIAGCYVQAQEPQFELQKKTSVAFDADSGEETGEFITVINKSFPLLKTKSGSTYVKGISSKTGKPYAIWIGKKTTWKYDGFEVYRFESGKYCIYKLSKHGFPYAVYLKQGEV